MFGEQKVAIPSMLRSSWTYDSFKLKLISSTHIFLACRLEKSKQNFLTKKDSFILINLITLPAIDLIWLVAISSNFQ